MNLKDQNESQWEKTRKEIAQLTKYVNYHKITLKDIMYIERLRPFRIYQYTQIIIQDIKSHLLPQKHKR